MSKWARPRHAVIYPNEAPRADNAHVGKFGRGLRPNQLAHCADHRGNLALVACLSLGRLAFPRPSMPLALAPLSTSTTKT